MAIVGYGSQGRAQALNLRDSGLGVRVGLRRGSENWASAQNDGFTPQEIAAAITGADVVSVLVPDDAHAVVVKEEIAPRLKAGAMLVFAYGGSVYFGDVTPPPGTDVVLVAPMGPGDLLRKLYAEGKGLNAKVAVAQDATGEAWPRALAYARALGCGRAGVFATTFGEEAKLDLFSEQVVLCGGIPALAEAAFETLVAGGYPPVLAYIECVREIKYIADLMYDYGVEGMRRRISTTALYGGVKRGRAIIGREARAAMRDVLTAIENGTFVKEFKKEFAGREATLAAARNNQLEEATAAFMNLLRRGSAAPEK